MSCNYYRITNYNNVQEGYYRWTGCTGSVNITTILNILDITAEWSSTNPTNVTKDAGDTNNYVTFLSGGSIVAQNIII